MKKIFTFLFVLCFTWVNGQIINNAEYCPEENLTIFFSFQQPTRYAISTTDLKGITIVQNITSGRSPSPYTGYAVIKFADQKGSHQFKVYDQALGGFTNTWIYKRVKTLEGNKPKWNPYPPPSVSPFAEWDDVFDISSVGGPCKMEPFTYTAPEVNYKDSDGTTFMSCLFNSEPLVRTYFVI